MATTIPQPLHPPTDARSTTLPVPDPEPGLLDDARRLSDALTDLIRVVQFRDRDRACCYDISVSQCYALKAVDDDGPLTVNELAGHLYLDKSTASRVAHGLVERGYLARNQDPEDGRAVRLAATDSGQQLRARIEADLAGEYAQLLADFDPAIRTAIVRLVARLGRAFALRVEASGGSCCVVGRDGVPFARLLLSDPLSSCRTQPRSTMSHTKEDVRKAVRNRYARAAVSDGSCCGPACCGEAGNARQASEVIGYSEDQLASLPEDANLGLGCGNPTAIASLSEGQTVLDLGSGAGIDCFLAARQVGPTGQVIGVDMTPEMVARARSNAAAGEYANVEFRLGEIEALPVADATVDVIISNCVLNLSPERARVLAETFRVLKPGGRLVVSDMVSDRAVPDVVQGSLDAIAGCLPTPRDHYLGQFRGAGFRNVRITEETPYPAGYVLSDPGVAKFLDEHPEGRKDVEAFAGSIFGAIFEAVKP